MLPLPRFSVGEGGVRALEVERRGVKIICQLFGERDFIGLEVNIFKYCEEKT
jgi:hypothetical protein